LHYMIADSAYTARVFGEGHSAVVQRLYRVLFPLARPLVRRGNGISGPRSLADGDAAMNEALDFVVRRSAATGYCAGDGFSVADLALASILAGATNPPGSTMDRPVPRPSGLERWLAQWAGHSGIAWVLRMYERHRGPGTD